MENNKRQIITPAEYFEQLKELKHENTNESLDTFYDASLALMKKYKLLGQKKMIRKLMFIVDCVPKEKQLLDMGINTFIYKDDIEEYINSVERKVVKIIELENYPRDIPEELIPIIQSTQDIFDRYFVLFTDYTGKVERQVEKERREKDPILFGAFIDNREVNEKLYYLGDWVDEYCDLTLEKLISEAGEKIVKNISVPLDKKSIIEECNAVIDNSGTLRVGGDSTWIAPITLNTPISTTGTANNVTVVQVQQRLDEVRNGSDN